MSYGEVIYDEVLDRIKECKDFKVLWELNKEHILKLINNREMNFFNYIDEEDLAEFDFDLPYVEIFFNRQGKRGDSDLESLIISLGYEEENYAYCECTQTMEGYNPLHNCCGHGCDWSRPVLQFSSKIYHDSKPFEGCQADLWELKDGKKERIKELERKIEGNKRSLNHQRVSLEASEKELEYLELLLKEELSSDE